MSQLIKCFFPASLDMIQSDAPVLLSSSVLTSFILHYSITICQLMHPSHSINSYYSIYLSFCSTLFSHLSLFLPSALLHSMQGIGRLILKEEMKARAGCHDNDQWGSRHSSRCSSKEALSNLGYSSLNGCKCVCVYMCLFTS